MSTDISTLPNVDEILSRVTPPLPEHQARLVRKAYEIARTAHEGQIRRSGKPYFSHCIAVTQLLAGLVNDWATLAAGLLHDTIEDCGMTEEQIREALPDPVAGLVQGVTKISTIHFSSDHELHANNLRKMILAMARDIRVVLIKLCDRLHNMRTLKYLDPERQKRIATGTIEIYAPLAGRLGMEEIADELEDLAMKHLQPVVYKRLVDHMGRNRARYHAIIDKTIPILENYLEKSHVQAIVSGRIKHIYSIYLKMLRGGLGLEEIHDLLAMRIITNTVAETYEALGIVHSRWKPVEGKFKDYIASPKPNGYRSLHTTVIGVEGEITEIQIRTQAMHENATLGIAAHWQYKEDGAQLPPTAVENEKIAWLRQLVDWLSDIRDPQEFMAGIKQDLYDNSVFCYTPAGDVIELAKDSTALDFAYRVHTEVGNHCAGLKVNNKMAPLRTRLKTGDIVEIMTGKAAHPTRDWLQFLTNTRARNKVRHWLKTHDRDHYIVRGRANLSQALKQRGAAITESEAMKKIEAIAPDLSLVSAEDVMLEIGWGTLKAGSVIARILTDEHPVPQPRKPPPRRSRRDSSKDDVLVEGMPGTLVRMAKCCHPEQGDPISGFITLGHGISIHHKNCSQLRRIREIHAAAPNRIVNVQWDDELAERIKATIRVVCQDRRGLLTDVTNAVSEHGISIISSHSQSNLRMHRAIIKLTVIVEDDDELNTLLRRLETLPSVLSLSRVINKR